MATLCNASYCKACKFAVSTQLIYTFSSEPIEHFPFTAAFSFHEWLAPPSESLLVKNVIVDSINQSKIENLNIQWGRELNVCSPGVLKLFAARSLFKFL